MSQYRAENTQSLGDLARGLATDVHDLVRGEIALARAEFDQKLHRILWAAVWMVGGALMGFAGLVVILLGVAALLAQVMPVWAASMIVGLVVIIVGAVLAKSGMGMLSLDTLVPDRTATNLQKDAEMLKDHT